jgi:hypothetical protein
MSKQKLEHGNHKFTIFQLRDTTLEQLPNLFCGQKHFVKILNHLAMKNLNRMMETKMEKTFKHICKKNQDEL